MTDIIWQMDVLSQGLGNILEQMFVAQGLVDS